MVWKANRAKSKVAKRLLDKKAPGENDLEAVVRRLTSLLYHASNRCERLRLLLEDWGFSLPMASAILTVFWPDEFTVYDIRVCDELRRRSLGDFRRLGGRSNFEYVCDEYFKYRDAVKCAASDCPSLRDKDRYLWGHSAARQLEEDIANEFNTTKGEES